MATMLSFDLVIFDCDGVLVDSERITNLVFAEMLAEIGLHFSLEEMFDRFVGRSMPACLERIATLRGAPPPDGFAERYRQRSAVALRDGLVAVDGIEDVIGMLPVPYCVASSGDHDKMRTTLGITGLLPLFDGKLFSVTEVARGKPFPDVYLHAAERSGVDPAHCAVVEDSPIGVAAGVAAGMTVFGYAKLMKPERLREAGASAIFDDMRDFPRLAFPKGQAATIPPADSLSKTGPRGGHP
jgi:HAD superfamily hydrolase (TIGR01509 family)